MTHGFWKETVSCVFHSEPQNKTSFRGHLLTGPQQSPDQCSHTEKSRLITAGSFSSENFRLAVKHQQQQPGSVGGVLLGFREHHYIKNPALGLPSLVCLDQPRTLEAGAQALLVLRLLLGGWSKDGTGLTGSLMWAVFGPSEGLLLCCSLSEG